MENKKNVILAVLIVGVVAMTVAFAALSTNLNISGTASVSDTTWNIHFQNWALDTEETVTEGGVTHQNTAEYPSVNQLSQTVSVANSTKVENLNVTLKQPGDYVKYTFQIINEGSIDASLNNFTHNMTCESGKTCNHLTYTVECKDSQENNVLTQYSTLYKNGGLAYCTLQVKYNEQTNTGNTVYTQESVTATLSANWQYIQKVDNNSGNSGSGGNEPVTPINSYETTFSGSYIAYQWYDVTTLGYEEAGNNWYTTLNQDSHAYLRTTGSLPELCGVFGSGQSGTVCMTSSYYNSSYSSAGSYASDFENIVDDTYDITTVAGLQATGLKGYSLAKAEEMLTKGAESCSVSIYGVNCYIPLGTGNCDIYSGGDVDCQVGDGSYPFIYNDGETS